MSLGFAFDGPSLRQAPEIFCGLRVVQSDGCLTQTEERLFPASKHRSRRIRKKLLKRFGGEFKMAPTCITVGDTLYIHPVTYRELRRHLQSQADTLSLDFEWRALGIMRGASPTGRRRADPEAQELTPRRSAEELAGEPTIIDADFSKLEERVMGHYLDAMPGPSFFREGRGLSADKIAITGASFRRSDRFVGTEVMITETITIQNDIEQRPAALTADDVKDMMRSFQLRSVRPNFYRPMLDGYADLQPTPVERQVLPKKDDDA